MKFASKFLFFMLCLVSCRNDAKFIMSDYQKLRDEIDIRQYQLLWTEAILPAGLVAKPSVPSAAAFPDALKARRDGEDIYPSAYGFGSLDTSMLPDEVLDLLDGFFATAVNPPPLGRSIDSTYLAAKYNFLPSILERHFSELPPVDNVMYGSPSILAEGFQIPVRFVGDGFYADANVFVVRNGLSYAIDQIQFGSVVGEPRKTSPANAENQAENSQASGDLSEVSDDNESVSENAEGENSGDNKNVDGTQES